MEESKASMFGTKVEVVLRKAEPGSWARLGQDAAAAAEDGKDEDEEEKEEEEEGPVTVDALDLDDLELSGATFQAVML